MGSILKNDKQRKMRNILLGCLVALGILLVIVGEKAREENENQKKATAAPVAESSSTGKMEKDSLMPVNTTTSEKNDTDSNLQTSGLSVNQQKATDIVKSDEEASEAPANQKPTGWMPSEKDGPTPAIKQALILQERNPGRYKSSKVAGSEIIYGIDTTSGQVWILTDENSTWNNLGKPEKAAPGPSSTFIIISSTPDNATIMDSSTSQTWKVSKDGKWVEIGGLPSDKSWK